MRRGLPAELVAERAGISRASLWAVEKGSSSVAMGIYVAVLNALSLEYDSDWIKNNPYSFFDPDLQLFRGRQYAPSEKNLFGVFTDSCPDRWGRILIRRREAIAQNYELTRQNIAENDK